MTTEMRPEQKGMRRRSFSACKSPLPTSLCVLTATVAAAFASGAWAQDSGGGAFGGQDPSPYYIGANQSITRDSNVYRTPEATADTYYSTGLLGGIDQPFGRQRFYANGNVQLNRYQNQDTQNNTSYGLRTGLDWSTIERISGSVNLSLNQGLASYGGSGTVPLRKKNVQSNDQFGANVKWGEASLLSLNAGYTHNRLRYSAEEYTGSELNQDAIAAGVTYRPSALLSLGAGLRHTRGRYPGLSEANGNSFTRNDLDLTTVWNASGQSTVSARLSIGRQSYGGGSARDFSGLTGSLAWAYKPTGKLSFNTVLLRDTGNETSFANLASSTGTKPVTLNGDNSRITNSISVNALYLATGKIRANAGVRYVRRSLAESTAVSSTGQQSLSGSDSSRGVTLGANYAPARNWLLACDLARDSRTASQDAIFGNLSYTYSVNTATCSAQFTFQ